MLHLVCMDTPPQETSNSTSGVYVRENLRTQSLQERTAKRSNRPLSTRARPHQSPAEGEQHGAALIDGELVIRLRRVYGNGDSLGIAPCTSIAISRGWVMSSLGDLEGSEGVEVEGALHEQINGMRGGMREERGERREERGERRERDEVLRGGVQLTYGNVLPLSVTRLNTDLCKASEEAAPLIQGVSVHHPQPGRVLLPRHHSQVLGAPASANHQAQERDERDERGQRHQRGGTARGQ
jgi:hypothetical protein